MAPRIATRERYYALCERLGIPFPLAKESYDRLDRQYTEPHRAYHGWDHIDYELPFFDKHRHLLTNPDQVELAIWHHDSYMITKRRPKGYPRNELLSAVQQDELLVLAGKDFGMRTTSFNLVMVTTHEEDKARTFDEMLFADGDWSPLAWPWEQYLENRSKIRFEYAHLSEKEFANGRAEWVLKMCRRKSHFYLPQFKQKFDQATQNNLTRELAEFRFQ